MYQYPQKAEGYLLRGSGITFILEIAASTSYIPRYGASPYFRLSTSSLISPLQPTTVELFLLLHIPYISLANFPPLFFQLFLERIAYPTNPTKMKCETQIPEVGVSELSIMRFMFGMRLADTGGQASDGPFYRPLLPIYS